MTAQTTQRSLALTFQDDGISVSTICKFVDMSYRTANRNTHSDLRVTLESFPNSRDVYCYVAEPVNTEFTHTHKINIVLYTMLHHMAGVFHLSRRPS